MATGGAGRFPSFDPEGSQKWTVYYQKFMFYCETKGVVEDAKRKAELICLSSDAMFEFMESVCRRNLSDEHLTFAGICTAVEEHLSPKPNEIAASAAFYMRNQLAHETVSDYVTEIRKLAKPANFGEFHDRAVRDRLVVGLANPEVRALLLRTPDLTADKAVDIARSVEVSQRQSREVQPNNGNNVNRLGDSRNEGRQRSNQNQAQQKTEVKCERCNGTTHESEKCRYKDLACDYCSFKGHIERACRKKVRDEEYQRKQSSKSKPKKVGQHEAGAARGAYLPGAASYS